MQVVDWGIVLAVFAGLAAIAVITKKHMHGVADFLAANGFVLEFGFRPHAGHGAAGLRPMTGLMISGFAA